MCPLLQAYTVHYTHMHITYTNSMKERCHLVVPEPQETNVTYLGVRGVPLPPIPSSSEAVVTGRRDVR
jgi:hypothetical protein